MEASPDITKVRRRRRRLLQYWVLGAGAGIFGFCFVSAYRAAKEHANSMACMNDLREIGEAARIWALDDGHGNLPADLISMSNQLVSPRILVCPSDHSRIAATNWADFMTKSSSYEILTPGAREGTSGTAYIRCKIHNNVVLADGSVQYANYLKSESR